MACKKCTAAQTSVLSYWPATKKCICPSVQSLCLFCISAEKSVPPSLHGKEEHLPKYMIFLRGLKKTSSSSYCFEISCPVHAEQQHSSSLSNIVDAAGRCIPLSNILTTYLVRVVQAAFLVLPLPPRMHQFPTSLYSAMRG